MDRQKDSKPTFVPGLDLAEGFFRDAVSPILTSQMPDLKYSAALIGSGSEVLGFDTEMSTDHHWGPRVMLFLRGADLATHSTKISALLAESLPFLYRGYPTNWSTPDDGDKGVQHLIQTCRYPVNHRVETLTMNGFFERYMGINVDGPLSAAEWLTIPHQKLRSVCAGRVFRDDLGLTGVRDRLAWYPHDVWLYVLASCWSRIGQDEHLTGRAGIVGDEIGSAVIALRLVRDIMRLAFLMERTYPPYAKWFGTAFAQLKCASRLQPALSAVLHATSWQERDSALASAYRQVAQMHNALGITPGLPCEPSPFFGRPFSAIYGGRFAESLRSAIQDDAVRSIAARSLIGNIDLVSDNTDLLEDAALRRAMLALYERPGMSANIRDNP